MLPDLPMVGREGELEWLRVRLNAGTGGVILLAGEGGVGKSRLLRAALVMAGALGQPAVLGHCPGPGETPAFGPWREALGLYAPAAGVRLAGLPPPFGTAPRPESSFELALEVANFLADRGPAAIALEDIHWADSASLDLLRHSAPRLARSSIHLLATYRPEELSPDHSLSSTLPALLRAGAAELRLGRLAPAHVDLLARAAGRPRAAAAVYSRSGGNPFFVRHLLAAPEDALPSTIQQAIHERLRRLSHLALEILRVAAVLGSEFRFDALCRCTDVPEAQVIEVLEEAVMLRVLLEENNRFAFDHALVREVLYAGVIGPRRQVLHRRAAAVAADPDQLAHHLERAGDPSAVPHLREAGDRALGLGAHAQAATYYERALELTAPSDALRPELLLLAGFAGTAANFSRASGFAAAALSAAEAAGDPVVAALARLQQALHMHQRKDPNTVPAMEEAYREVQTLQSDARMVALYRLMHQDSPASPGAPSPLAHAYLSTGRAVEAEALVHGALSHLGTATRGSSADHLVLAVTASLLRGDTEETLRQFRLSVEAALAARNYAEAADRLVAQLHATLMHRGTDQVGIDQLAQHVDEVWRLASHRSGGDPFGGRSPYLELWFRRGDWTRARQEVDLFRTAGSRVGDRLTAFHHWIGILLDCEQGNLEQARRLVREHLPPDGPGSAPPYGFYLTRMYMLTAAARVFRLCGELDEARAWLSALDAWHRGPRPSYYNYALGQLEWAQWHRAAGDPAAARSAATAALRMGTAMRSEGIIAEASLQLGALGGRERERCLERALTLWERSGFAYDSARARAVRGRREDLTAAREVFARLGAAPALARAEESFAQLQAGTPGAILTTREQEVVRQVALGLSDREIAARLFLSPRTVDWHLRNIFTKLDLPSRSGLVAWAVRHGLAPRQ